jgi:hypothetical protein
MLISQPLTQPDATGEAPFLCIAGVREYHDHPGHSGDSWDLHRTTGAGRVVVSEFGVAVVVVKTIDELYLAFSTNPGEMCFSIVRS